MAKHDILYPLFGLIDDKTGQLIKGAEKGLSDDGLYKADHPKEGATTANFTGIEAAGTAEYANGQVKRISYGKSEPQLALTMLDIDFTIKQKLKGWAPDGKGGWAQHLPKAHVAVLIVSESFSGSKIYEALANAEVVEATSNNGTDNTASTNAPDELTLQGQGPIDKTKFVDPLDSTKNLPYKIWDGSDDNCHEEDVLKEVFPGYTPVGGSSSASSQVKA